MSITSSEIREVGFEHSLRGYDIEQVDVFLEKVAVGVEELALENEQLKTKVAEAVKAAEEAAAQAAEAQAQIEAEPEPVAAPVVDTEEIERANARAQDAESALAEAQARLRDAERRMRDAEAKVADLQHELEEKNDRDKIISEAFISAQRSAENLKEEARAEGERIYRESEAKARQLIREALSKKQQIFTEIDTLEASCQKFRKDYKKMIEHFAADAEGTFADMRPPVIPDSIINELMPKAETLEQAVEAAAEEENERLESVIPEDRIPSFDTTDVIPPLPTDDDQISGQTFDDGFDVEEI